MIRNIITLLFVITSQLLFAQTFPYSINKKKFPLGDDFDKIMPQKIGEWKRFSFHDFVIGGETGTVYYRKNDKQVFVSFGKAYSQENLQSAWIKMYDDVMGKSKTKSAKVSTQSSKNIKYIYLQSTYNQYLAWTRNLYFFSIQTKHKSDADEFIKLFPY